ncbi:MAG: glycosyltransferase, partial [Micromonosporaceae bacterium]|nr:glycosyltransferase [Micromonosporaceae bacterium]
MASRLWRGGPRAHWVLLYLFSAVCFVLLCFNGYVMHIGAEGSGDPPSTGGTAGVPASVSSGGPILRIAPNGAISTRGMPSKTIALTFDDGPDPKYTPQILAILARYHAHATFFEIGSRVDRYPDVSRSVVAAGSEIGSHTFTHVEPGATAGWQLGLELTWSANAIAGATGKAPVLMRPPYASTPDAITNADLAAMRRVASAGYLVVVADHDTSDWERPGVNTIVNRALPAGVAGEVVMMHDSGGDRSQTVAAVAQLIPRLQAQGYRFVTVSEALKLGPAPAASTSERIRGELLSWAQRIASWLATILTVVAATALTLSGLRLLVQLWCARRHSRAHRRMAASGTGRLRYFGPVSVIVPAFNEAANIEATVRSLCHSDYPELEVIVVDDGSTDGTAEIVRRLGLPLVRVIRQPNAGKPVALNTGIQHARGRLIVLVDGDTVFEPDALGRLVQPFADASVGAVS